MLAGDERIDPPPHREVEALDDRRRRLRAVEAASDPRDCETAATAHATSDRDSVTSGTGTAAITRSQQHVRIDALGERLVGQHEPVAQHVERERAHVVRQHERAAAQQRERAPAVDQVDRSARAGAVLDVAERSRRARTCPGRACAATSATAYSFTARSTNTSCGGVLGLDQPLGREHLLDLGRARQRAVDDGHLLVLGRVVDDHLEHEPVDLRLRQRVGALRLDRVLRREHEKRVRGLERVGPDRDLALLHHLEQRGLHLRGRAVDLVGEQEVAEAPGRARSRSVCRSAL